MKKFLIMFILLISIGNSYSQNREALLNELSEYLEASGHPSELFYIEEDNILDILGHQIPLSTTKARYEESKGPMLGFYCSDLFLNPDCIYNPGSRQSVSSFSFSMKDKESVYKAINLVNQIMNTSKYGFLEVKAEVERKAEIERQRIAEQQRIEKSEAEYNGKVTGDPYASGYSGGGYRLGNRTALTKPKPDYPCNEEGKIVVKITVDQSGTVISAEPGAKGTTNNAGCLLKEAKEAALKTRFNQDSKAPPKQVGVVTYNFSLSE